MAEAELDAALGLGEERQMMASSYDPRLESAHATESVVYLPTPYPVCRALFHTTAPQSRDLVVDLGCGSGRLVLYGALCTSARFLGVELIGQRCAAGQRTVTRLSLGQVEIVEGNVLDLDLEPGTLFYLFRPFSKETETTMMTRLHNLARRRAITVAAYRLLPTLFDPQIFDCTVIGDLRIYRSTEV
ncbi:MAG: hypothetical protein DRI90_11375 [Deltaproteobacteria bacterium]|nr:MAG: hypothetical protein DRI90_11375 [Deltaproteobacteria bacterium]